MKLPEDERRAFDRYAEDLHYQAGMVESSYGVGRLKGRQEAKIEVAISLFDILDDETIAKNRIAFK